MFSHVKVILHCASMGASNKGTWIVTLVCIMKNKLSYILGLNLGKKIKNWHFFQMFISECA